MARKHTRNVAKREERGVNVAAVLAIAAVLFAACIGAVQWGAGEEERDPPAARPGAREPASAAVYSEVVKACDGGDVLRLERLLERHAVGPGDTNLVERALTQRFNKNDVTDTYNEVVRVLLQHNRELLTIPGTDLCPVFHAVSYRNHKALATMLTHGSADALRHCLTQRDANNRTALHLAAQSQAAGMSRLYLVFKNKKRDVPPTILQSMDLRKASLQSLDYKLLTASCGTKDIELLVKAGADCSAQDASGRTPLHFAAYDGHKRAVKTLLKLCPTASGIAVQRASGWSPKDLAAITGHPAVADLLPAVEGAPPAGDYAPVESTYAVPANEWVASSAAEAYAGSGCPFKKVNCQDITLQQFQEDFMVPGQPVLLVNCMNKWKAAREWTRQGLVRKYGTVPLSVGGIAYPETYGEKGRRVLLRDWVTEVDALASMKEHKVGTPFAFEGRIGQLTDRAVYDDFDMPEMLQDYPVHSLEFSVGPPLSGANMHLHGEVLNAVVVGRKRWTLVSPGHAYFSTALSKEFLDSEEHLREGSYTCYQGEGEVLYVPRCWGHAVMNINTTIALVATLRV